MFEALLLRKQEAERREYVRAGIVAAAIYNANPFRGKDARPLSPLDFVPGGQAEKNMSLTDQVQAVSSALGVGPKKARKVKGK